MKRSEFEKLPAELREKAMGMYRDSCEVYGNPKDELQKAEYAGFMYSLQMLFGKENLLPPIRTWGDLVNRGEAKEENLSLSSTLIPYVCEGFFGVAQTMLILDQLMPHYGGAITAKEWETSGVEKYVIRPCTPQYEWKDDGERLIKEEIESVPYEIKQVRNRNRFTHLAFHERSQAEGFLEYNLDLVKAYYTL